MISLGALGAAPGGYMEEEQQRMQQLLQRAQMQKYMGELQGQGALYGQGGLLGGGGMLPGAGPSPVSPAGPAPTYSGGDLPDPMAPPSEQMMTAGGPGMGARTAQDPRGLMDFIRWDAQRYGIDPDTAVRVAMSEGLRDPVGDQGRSFGAFQLYTGGGMGNDFQRATGLDPRNPANERAGIDFALRQAAQGGWGPFHGAANTGIGPWQGISRGGPQQPLMAGMGGGAPGPSSGQLGPQQAFAQAGGAPGGGMPPGGIGNMTMEQVAAMIRQRNPGISPQGMQYALTQYMHLMQPYERQQFQAYMQLQRQQFASGQAETKAAERASELEEKLAAAEKRQQEMIKAQADRQAGREAAAKERLMAGQKFKREERESGQTFKMDFETFRQQNRKEMADVTLKDKETLKAIDQQNRQDVAQGVGIAPNISYQTARRAAEEFIATQKMPSNIPSTGALGRANKAYVNQVIDEIAEEKGISTADIVGNRISLVGAAQASRTNAQQGAKIDSAIAEFQRVKPLVLAQIDKLTNKAWRTESPKLNQFLQEGAAKYAGDPDVTTAVNALTELAQVQAQIMNRGQPMTVAVQQRAIEQLDKYWNAGQLRDAIELMDKSARAVKQSNVDARDEIREYVRGVSTPGAGRAVLGGRVSGPGPGGAPARPAVPGDTGTGVPSQPAQAAPAAPTTLDAASLKPLIQQKGAAAVRRYLESQGLPAARVDELMGAK